MSIAEELVEGIRSQATPREILLNTRDWNYTAMNHALIRRNNPNKDVAISACRDAARYAGNISHLNDQLERLSND